MNDIKAVEETAVTMCTGEVTDEFCRNAEYCQMSNVRFTFKSEYREEDIEYSIRKILPEDAVCTLVSRARIGWTADHLCVLELEEVDHENFVWPEMNSSDEEVLRELERM